MAAQVQEGRVKWFSFSKGYGFIESPDEGGKDLFVHHRNIRTEYPRFLEEGERVSFEVEQTEKGPQAVNVVRLDAVR